jgi:hypothetical protein
MIQNLNITDLNSLDEKDNMLTITDMLFPSKSTIQRLRRSYGRKSKSMSKRCTSIALVSRSQ